MTIKLMIERYKGWRHETTAARHYPEENKRRTFFRNFLQFFSLKNHKIILENMKNLKKYCRGVLLTRNFYESLSENFLVIALEVVLCI